MLGVSAAFDDHLDQKRGMRSDLFGPFNDPGGSPFQIFLVRRRHVLFECGVTVENKASDVGEHALAFEEGLHRMGGEPDMELFSKEAKRTTVVVVLHLDVVVNIDGGHFPLGVLIRLFGNTKCVGIIEQFEQFPARLRGKRR